MPKFLFQSSLHRIQKSEDLSAVFVLSKKLYAVWVSLFIRNGLSEMVYQSWFIKESSTQEKSSDFWRLPEKSSAVVVNTPGDFNKLLVALTVAL